MSPNLAMSVMGIVEFALWTLLGFLFWNKKLQRRYPAMSVYLALRIASTPILLGLNSGDMVVQSDTWKILYFYGFYAVYIVSAALLFFVLMEVFRSALSGFAGLMKFGEVVFRWVVLASVIVTFSTISFSHRGAMVLPDIGYGLMRSVSILELCLLAFLCLAMNALRLSIRNMAFGISLGFGLMSTNDLVTASLISHNSSPVAPLQFVYQAIALVALGVWVMYAALPEPVRKPVVVQANSTIYRWNEIASALGHTGTQVAVQQPANSFFLSDVEKVVEKVLTRNLRESESKL